MSLLEVSSATDNTTLEKHKIKFTMLNTVN